MSRITIDDIEEIGYHSTEGTDSLLTVPEVCELLKFKRSYLYSLTSRQEIPHVKIHGLLRFRLSAIEEWIAGQEVRIGDKET